MGGHHTENWAFLVIFKILVDFHILNGHVTQCRSFVELADVTMFITIGLIATCVPAILRVFLKVSQRAFFYSFSGCYSTLFSCMGAISVNLAVHSTGCRSLITESVDDGFTTHSGL